MEFRLGIKSLNISSLSVIRYVTLTESEMSTKHLLNIQLNIIGYRVDEQNKQ